MDAWEKKTYESSNFQSVGGSSSRDLLWTHICALQKGLKSVTSIWGIKISSNGWKLEGGGRCSVQCYNKQLAFYQGCNTDGTSCNW